jgi:putative endonuclease
VTKQSQKRIIESNFYIYFITNEYNFTIYIGVTNNLIRRIYEHKNKLVDGFSKKYNLNKLVYYEIFENAEEAIKREKQLKGGSRKQKEELIKNKNPKWQDLYENIL